MTRLTLHDTPRDIWVVAEMEDGRLTPLTLEMTYGARMSADLMGFYVNAAVLGSQLPEFSAELIQAGADRVYRVDHPSLARPSMETWLRALSDLFAAQAPEFVLLGATPLGEALAPRLAQRFGGGLIARCQTLKVDDFDRALVGRRAVYGGAYYEMVATAGPAPQFATVLPDCFGPPFMDASRLGETETAPAALDEAPPAVRWEPVEFDLPRPRLKHARRVVSVGRQVGDVARARRLADALGAEFAGAREAIDQGFIDESRVVGVTGARVSPDLYVALGIRGDTLHAFGMQDARFVVAVHPDPDAPILKQADAAIVGDPAQVVDDLLRAL